MIVKKKIQIVNLLTSSSSNKVNDGDNKKIATIDSDGKGRKTSGE